MTKRLVPKYQFWYLGLSLAIFVLLMALLVRSQSAEIRRLANLPAPKAVTIIATPPPQPVKVITNTVYITVTLIATPTEAPPVAQAPEPQQVAEAQPAAVEQPAQAAAADTGMTVSVASVDQPTAAAPPPPTEAPTAAPPPPTAEPTAEPLPTSMAAGVVVMWHKSDGSVHSITVSDTNYQTSGILIAAVAHAFTNPQVCIDGGCMDTVANDNAGTSFSASGITLSGSNGEWIVSVSEGGLSRF